MASTEPEILTNNPLVKEFYDNSQSNIVRINDDKLKVILLEHKDMISKNNDYLTPLTLLISFIVTFCTADFKDFINVSGATWKGFYIFCCLATGIWLFIELRRMKKTCSIDELIAKIKNETAE